MKRVIYQQCFPSVQERRGESACYKFKGLESVPTLRAFQNGGFTQPQRSERVRRLLIDYFCKIDLKDAYFGIPLAQKSQKYVRFFWKEKLYEFVCLCFGLSPLKNFYKIAESAQCLSEKAQYKSDNLLGRPAHYGRLKGGIDSSKRHSVLSPTTPRKEENSRTLQKHLKEKETTVLDLTKIIGLLSSAAQAVMPARLQFRFLQNQLIQLMKEGVHSRPK